ncbi:hypothetical protein AMELA_G00230930 [Ameiurus melas]|uniref:Uncharacterized protein n=1 Tax=Ameiurus melas TaxID=219545 RepID=A0A7J5ZWV2_AMEME|nr:hypothetical protein AMELA_G00230930 [Ameiurus melas]
MNASSTISIRPHMEGLFRGTGEKLMMLGYHPQCSRQVVRTNQKLVRNLCSQCHNQVEASAVIDGYHQIGHDWEAAHVHLYPGDRSWLNTRDRPTSFGYLWLSGLCMLYVLCWTW